MKTYPLVAVLMMAFSFVACEKSNETVPDELSSGSVANYTVFLKSNDRLSTQFIGSTDEGLFLKNESPTFFEIPSNALKYRSSDKITCYFTTNCKAKVQLYNVANDASTVQEIFSDLDVCSISVTAISQTNDYLILSYVRELAGKERQLMLRFISLASENLEFIDIPLDKKPVDMISSSNRLFVLTLDEFVTDAFHLQVIDMTSKEPVMELDLGKKATKLFKNNAGDIIIGNPDLHTTLNPITLEKSYTMYGENTEPGFLTTNDSFMDSYGKLYFQKTIPSAQIQTVPAIYDFQKNKTVVYLYENFLSETELKVKYDIAATTSIAYDEQNDFVLIGYAKNNKLDEGGILRIRPTPNFKIIDNIDLAGIPQTIFVK